MGDDSNNLTKVSRDDLRAADGREGRPAYFAYKGKVYDVSGSVLWRNGAHVRVHFAGMDLTSEIEGAPHGNEVLERAKLVGILEDIIPGPPKQGNVDKLKDLYRKLHPHPVSVHYPIALIMFSIFFLFLYEVTRMASFETPSFETTSFYLLVCGTLMAFPSVISGLISWKITYMATMTPTFKRKLQLSAVLIIMAFVCVSIRWFVPDVVFAEGKLKYLYILLVFSLAPVTVGLGYFGGKITFPS